MGERIFVLLRDLCIPPDLKGYDYLVSALRICEDNPAAYHDMMGLYKEVAVANKTTPARAERSIRHAIEVTFDRSRGGIAADILNPASYAVRGKPTNSQFISAIARYMRMVGEGAS